MNQHSSTLLCPNRLVLTCLIGCAGLLFACEKDDPKPLATNNAIRGSARLYDDPYDNNLAGIKVLASGPYGDHSTFTDEYGSFFIGNLGNGTYWLDYSKDGNGTIRQYNLSVMEGDTVWAGQIHLFSKPELSVLPVFEKAYIDYRDRYGPPTEFLHIETNITDQQTLGLDMMLYMDTSDEVDYDRSVLSFPANDACYTDEGKHAIYVEKTKLPFASGTKVYIIGYPCNPWEYHSGYLDIYLGERVFSTLDVSRPANVISFTMP